MSKKLKRFFKKSTKQRAVKSRAKKNNAETAQKSLLMTMTNEPFQLARIHYDLRNKDELERIFSKLKCIEYDPSNKRWLWLYHAEAKGLKFRKSYKDILKKFHPVVIGSFFMSGEGRMYLDVNSFDRVVQAILFFDEFLNCDILFLSHIQVVNKLFDAIPGIVPKPREYFDSNVPNKPDGTYHSLEALIFDDSLDQNKKQSMVYEYMDNVSRQPIDQVESLAIHFYEDGIEHIDVLLKMRNIVAYEHWRGNKDFTLKDVFNQMYSL